MRVRVRLWELLVMANGSMLCGLLAGWLLWGR